MLLLKKMKTHCDWQDLQKYFNPIVNTFLSSEMFQPNCEYSYFRKWEHTLWMLLQHEDPLLSSGSSEIFQPNCEYSYFRKWEHALWMLLLKKMKTHCDLQKYFNPIVNIFWIFRIAVILIEITCSSKSVTTIMTMTTTVENHGVRRLRSCRAA